MTQNPLQVLVPEGRINAADRLLADHGWTRVRTLPPPGLRAFVAGCRYRHSDTGDLLLCWRPFGPDCATAMDAAVWERAVPANDQRPELPDATDLAMMARRGGSLLQLCIALARLLPEVDAADIASRARQLGFGPPWARFDAACERRGTAGLPIGLLQGPLDSGWLPLPDEHVALPRLLARHWRRYRRCPRGARPGSFPGYLARYYRHAWQPAAADARPGAVV